MRTAVGAMAVIVVSLLTSGCGDDGSSMEIRVDRAILRAGDHATFSVSVSDGLVRDFTLSDFSEEGEGLPTTGRFQVPDSGVLVLQPNLEVDGELATDGEAEIELRQGFEWSVTIFRQAEDPAESCIGCIGSQQIAIDPAFREGDNESLWVTWGGSAEGDDVVF